MREFYYGWGFRSVGVVVSDEWAVRRRREDPRARYGVGLGESLRPPA
jgi:hypothetical protein